MTLITEQEKQDYYYGKIARLADDLSIFDEMIEWLSLSRNSDKLREQAEILESLVNKARRDKDDIFGVSREVLAERYWRNRS